MKFTQHLKEAYRHHTSLTLARIKVDPLLKDAKNLADIAGYEGYVLEEDEESCHLYVVDIGSTMTVPSGHMTYSEKGLKGFKKDVIKRLQTHHNLESNAAELIQIHQAADTEQIESVLRGMSLDSNDIMQFYRNYVNEFLEQS